MTFFQQIKKKSISGRKITSLQVKLKKIPEEIAFKPEKKNFSSESVFMGKL